MVANSVPYFHNNPRVSQVRVHAKKFVCIGDLPPFDHPHIYIDMREGSEIVCPYCATLFAYDPHLAAVCDPAECEFHPESVPEPVAPPRDISIATAPPPVDIGIVTFPPQPEFVPPPTPQMHAPMPVIIETTNIGMAASFETEGEWRTALQHLQGVSAETQTYTPKAVEDGSGEPRVPLAMLIAGLIGFSGAFAMEALANVVSYPLDIGGRPTFSWPSFVPIAFEIGVLCAMLGGFFGYLVAARMPRLYDPVDEFALMRDAMGDRWVIAIRAADAQTLERAREILRGLHPSPEGEGPA